MSKDIPIIFSGPMVRALLEALNGPSAWNDNPFVVAPSFRVIKANIDAPEARAVA